ncbi:MAG: YceI family protein [Bacteroidetes bacterium]|nr:YceI family protein [Bacteroidota bacterium]
MKKILALSWFCFLLVGFTTKTPSRSVITAYIEDNSRLFINGSSNINTFECNSKDKYTPLSVGIILNETSDTMWLTNASLQLLTKNLDCSNPKMNSDLRDALNADQYPIIKINLLGAMTLGAVRFDDIEYDWKTLKTVANLTITNVTKRIVMDMKVRKIDNGKYQFVAVKEVRMTDYNVKPPEVLLGMIKVNNHITINLDITARLVKEP